MNTLFSKLLPILLVVVLCSCSNEDDGIFINNIITETASYNDIELEIIDLINEHRKSLNLNELKPMNVVSVVADEHTDYMIQIGEITHENFSMRYQKLVEAANAKNVGENLAYGYCSAISVVNAWLCSDSHRKVIESKCYTDVGISSEANAEGRIFYTQIFIER